MTTREALLSMCYREEKPGKWCKPVAFQLFVFEEKTNTWTNWFKNIQDELVIWESKRLEADRDPLRELKEFETWTRTDLYCSPASGFQLSAVDL